MMICTVISSCVTGFFLGLSVIFGLRTLICSRKANDYKMALILNLLSVKK